MACLAKTSQAVGIHQKQKQFAMVKKPTTKGAPTCFLQTYHYSGQQTPKPAGKSSHCE
jgi:hypothetical protein